MDTASLIPLLEQLDDHMDDLEEDLEPFIGPSLAKISKNLPVMDKAKLHVLITYTLESLLFSYLRLHGIDAKQHPVFKELTRVKQYFEKIKTLETEPVKRSMTLDKAAAGRFIKAGLAGNDKYDSERAEREAKEKAVAAFKAAKIAKKMEAASQKSLAPESGSPSAAMPTAPSTADSDLDDSSRDEAVIGTQSSEPGKVKGMKTRKGVQKGKKPGKRNKAERSDEKKERRQKKEQTRQARKAGGE